MRNTKKEIQYSRCKNTVKQDVMVLRTSFRGLIQFQQKKVKGQGQKVNCIAEEVCPIKQLTKYGSDPMRVKENSLTERLT